MKPFNHWIDKSNTQHIRFINLGYLARNKMMELYWVALLTKAKNAYYAGNPIMDDKTYDHFENNLKELNPECGFLQKVGYDVD